MEGHFIGPQVSNNIHRANEGYITLLYVWGNSQRANFWSPGCSWGLLYHGLFAAINRLCPLIPMDRLCPVYEVYAPPGPIFLSGWLTILFLCMEWISFKILIMEYIHPMDAILANFSRHHLIRPKYDSLHKFDRWATIQHSDWCRRRVPWSILRGANLDILILFLTSPSRFRYARHDSFFFFYH